MKYLLLFIVLLSALLHTTFAYAQDLSSCPSVAHDADGDGYGWVINPRSQSSELFREPYSCIVDESSERPETIINLETNTEVQRIRAYWDANRDLAGRNLSCEEYYFSTLTESYTQSESYNRYHYPLPNQKPWVNVWEKTIVGGDRNGNKTSFLWSVVDGVLRDDIRVQLEHGSTIFYDWRFWVELIDINGGTRNATRWWKNSSQYIQCTDPETNVFLPTGAPDMPPTQSSVEFSDQSVVFTPPVGTPQPDIDHEDVVLTRGVAWDLNDLAFKLINCSSYSQSTDSAEPPNTYWRYNDPSDYNVMFLPGTMDNPRTGFVFSQGIHGGFTSGGRWIINDNGSIENSGAIGSSEWFELASDGNGKDVLILWQNSQSVLICQTENVKLDTAFTWKRVSESDQNAFLIKSDIDTSHCTSEENSTENPRFIWLNTCVVSQSGGSDTDSDDSVATEENNPTDNVSENAGGADLTDISDSDSMGNTSSVETGIVSTTGESGGGSIGIALLLGISVSGMIRRWRGG